MTGSAHKTLTYLARSQPRQSQSQLFFSTDQVLYEFTREIRNINRDGSLEVVAFFFPSLDFGGKGFSKHSESPRGVVWSGFSFLFLVPVAIIGE